MDWQTLQKSQLGYVSDARAQALVAGCNAAMLAGDITTVNRCAMFLAQVGFESGSLRYTQEISPPAGATYPPYIGRTFIQITWDYNYRAFGRWMYNEGKLGDPNLFVNHPTELAKDQWAWWGAVWFWSTHGLNALADQGDVYGATQRINGGYNGIDGRVQRWNACRKLGTALLPVPPKSVEEEVMSYYKDRADFEAAIQAIVRKEVQYAVVQTTNLIEEGDKPLGHRIQTVIRHELARIGKL